MIIIIVLLLIVIYGLLGFMLLLMKDMFDGDYDIPDIGDLLSGKLEPDEQNRAVLFITFWPVILLIYLVKFTFKAVKAIYKAIVWYVKGFVSSTGENKKGK